jgi:endonuclease VIII
MPEGDTIFRTARTLHRALAGRVVTRFESVYPALTRVDADAPLRGRTVERVEARGKHVLMWFSGRLEAGPTSEAQSWGPPFRLRDAAADPPKPWRRRAGGPLILRTHMRMHGSWHVYRPGERWQRPRHEMRILIETDAIHAIAFNVPVAELATAAEIERGPALGRLGPGVLADDFDATDAVRRISERSDMSIADALLDQSAIAGIGNIYKCEALFVAKVHPFAAVASLPPETISHVVAIAAKMMRANVAEPSTGVSTPRRTTHRADPRVRFWVYGRGRHPCRRCGTPIRRDARGADARVTYWCPRCQPSSLESIDPR